MTEGKLARAVKVDDYSWAVVVGDFCVADGLIEERSIEWVAGINAPASEWAAEKVRVAVLQERERCAKIAQAYTDPGCARSIAGENIAMEIWCVPPQPEAKSEICGCKACHGEIIHSSDCAVHNEPAFPNGPCDCGAEAKAGEAGQ